MQNHQPVPGRGPEPRFWTQRPLWMRHYESLHEREDWSVLERAMARNEGEDYEDAFGIRD